MTKADKIRGLCLRGFTMSYVVNHINGDQNYIERMYKDCRVANWKDGYPKFYKKEMEFENEMEYGTKTPSYQIQDLVGEELKIYLKLKDNETKKED